MSESRKRDPHIHISPKAYAEIKAAAKKRKVSYAVIVDELLGKKKSA